MCTRTKNDVSREQFYLIVRDLVSAKGWGFRRIGRKEEEVLDVEYYGGQTAEHAAFVIASEFKWCNP